MHHSIPKEDDGIIISASDEKQVDETLKACEMSPLPESAVNAFNDSWKENKDTVWKYAA
jgi:aryl-alcohol dehydrogenase-like predicted oxidoreductase